MDRRLHLLAFLLFQIEPVTLFTSVWRYKGGDVVLQCTNTDPDVVTLSDEDIKFAWRHNGTKVYDVNSRKPNLSDQHERFKGRTSQFPDELHKGNFSIRLTNLTEDDNGMFTCFPLGRNDYGSQAVELHIKDKPTEPNSPEPRKPTGNSSVQTCSEKSIFSLLFLLSLIVLPV